MSTLPAHGDDGTPDVRDVVAAMGGEVIGVTEYHKGPQRLRMVDGAVVEDTYTERGIDVDKVKARIEALSTERTQLIALRAEIADHVAGLHSQIAESEQRRALALSRITGINGALEELRALTTDPPGGEHEHVAT